VIALPAYRWQRRVVVPKDHPLAALDREPTLEELAAQPLVSYDSSLKPESSLRRAFEAAGLQPQIAMTAADADLIKTYVRAGLGVGVLAEMALLPADSADLRTLAADHLFAPCTTWVVLRRESVLREFMLAFIADFAPQLDRKAVARHVSGGEAVTWPTAPTWRERALKVAVKPVAAKA
jgi:DNA-binding transcriptional LysR family regulator